MKKYINFITNTLLSQMRKPYPFCGVFWVTERCNSRCNMCGIWKIHDKKEMDLNTFKKIFEESKLLRKLSLIVFTGGEPFIKDDLPEFVEVVNRVASPLNITLDTNGFATSIISTKLNRILAKSKVPINIKLSLDGIEGTHDEIRGVDGAFKMCMDTLNELSELKKKYPKQLWVSLGFTASSRNYHQIHKVIDLAKNKGMGFFYKPIMHAQKLENDDIDANLFLSEAQKDYLVKQHNTIIAGLNHSYFGKRYLYRKYLSFLKKYYRKPDRYIPCYALLASFHISADWKVFSCLKHSWVIGDLQSMTFDEIFYGDSASLIRQQIRRSKCSCLCTGDIFPSIIAKSFLLFL